MKKNDSNIWIWIGIGSFVAIGLTSFILLSKRKFSCNNSFLFLGNSHTAHTSSYADFFSKNCVDGHINKIAKVGSQSGWILDEYKKELAKGNHYDLVTVMIGVNDIFARRSIDKTKINIDELIDLAKSDNSKIVFLSSPNIKFYAKTTPQHNELYADLEDYLKNKKGVHKFISTEIATDDINLFARDNLHLTSKGHEAIYEVFANKILKRKTR